jgi:hypothetical protein
MPASFCGYAVYEKAGSLWTKAFLLRCPFPATAKVLISKRFATDA